RTLHRLQQVSQSMRALALAELSARRTRNTNRSAKDWDALASAQQCELRLLRMGEHGSSVHATAFLKRLSAQLESATRFTRRKDVPIAKSSEPARSCAGGRPLRRK